MPFHATKNERLAIYQYQLCLLLKHFLMANNSLFRQFFKKDVLKFLRPSKLFQYIIYKSKYIVHCSWNHKKIIARFSKTLCLE